MQMHEAVELKEAGSVNQANAAIQEGWKLLAVTSASDGNNQLAVIYVLGRKAGRPQIPRGVKPVMV